MFSPTPCPCPCIPVLDDDIRVDAERLVQRARGAHPDAPLVSDDRVERAYSLVLGTLERRHWDRLHGFPPHALTHHDADADLNVWHRARFAVLLRHSDARFVRVRVRAPSAYFAGTVLEGTLELLESFLKRPWQFCLVRALIVSGERTRLGPRHASSPSTFVKAAKAEAEAEAEAECSRHIQFEPCLFACAPHIALSAFASAPASTH